MSQKKDLKSKKTRRWRRFFRFLIWFTLVLIVLLLAINITVRLVFPEEKVRVMLAEQVYKASGRSFFIKKLSWSLLGSLDAEGIEIGFTAEEQSPDSLFFSLDNARIRFKLLPILRRSFEVTEILISHPKLTIVPPPSSVADSDTGGQARDSLTGNSPQPIQPLPVSLALNRFVLDDFDLKLLIPDSLKPVEMTVTNLNLTLDNLSIPKQFPENAVGAGGVLRLFTEGSEIRYRDKDMDLDYVPALDWLFRLEEDRWDLLAELRLNRSKQNIPDIAMELNCRGEGLGRTLQINTWTMDLGGQRVIDVSGRASITGIDTLIRMDFKEREMDVSQLQSFIESGLPPVFQSLIPPLKIAGKILPLSGSIAGKSDSLVISLKSMFSDLSVLDTNTKMNGDSLNGEVLLSGVWTRQGLEGGSVSVNFYGHTVSLPIEGVPPVTVQNLGLQIRTSLNEILIPVQGEFGGRIGQVFEGPVDFDGSWQVPALPKLNGIRAKLFVALDSMNLEAIPIPDSPISGMAGAELTVSVSGLDSLNVNIAGGAVNLRLLSAERPDPVPDILMTAEIDASISPELDKLTVRTAHIQVDSLLSLQADGTLDLADSTLFFQLTDGVLRNEAIFSHVPESVRESLLPFDFGGRERIQAGIRGKLGRIPPVSSLEATLTFEEIWFFDRQQDLTVDGIQGYFEFLGNLNHMAGHGEMQINSVDFPVLRSEPIQKIVVKLDMAWDQPVDIRVNNGRLQIPGLGLKSDFDLSVSLSDSLLDLAGGIRMRLDNTDWVNMVQELALRGGLETEMTVSTLDASRQYYRLDGLLKTDGLDIRQANILSIQGVRARVPYQIDANMKTAELIPDTGFVALDWAEYERQREWIRSFSPWVSNFSIDTVNVTGYEIRNVLMDMDIHQGRIQIPWFEMKLFEGNLGGSLWIDPATGNPDQIRYGLRAQASRINSAALIGDQSIEESELNGNLSFTGKGVNPNTNMDVDGYLYITQIGPKFTSTLLKGLEQGSDRSIRLTRRLLDMGWQAKLFSFELRHGFVYPSLTLSQPWFSPVRIPGRLEYGRLPLAFFLTNTSLTNK